MSLSYKSSYLITLFLNLVTITMYFFFSKLNPDMEIFGISATYFEFAFIGLALQFIVGTSLATVNGSIYNEIISGTWSSLLLHFNFAEYAIGTTLAGTFLASFSIFISLGISYAFFGFSLSITAIQIVLICLLFLLILSSHMVISMLFAAFTIYYQKNSGIVPLLYQLTKTFSGIVFPVALLRGFPIILSRSLPLTYGLEALHNVILSDNIQWVVVQRNSLVLIGIILIIGILSFIFVSMSIKHSKKHNKVDWY
ncbi:MAG: hypothetical protein KGD64_08795 [Candidatus Heimdallarchaeota archaeon]|nr:hypothetical protein [Candidatus Heimdallarchaeota archaeon]